MYARGDDISPMRAEVLTPGLEGVINLLWQTHGSGPLGFMLVAADGRIISLHHKGELEEALGPFSPPADEPLLIEEWFPGYRAFRQAKLKGQKSVCPINCQTAKRLYSPSATGSTQAPARRNGTC
jgi:hypothetical protein